MSASRLSDRKCRRIQRITGLTIVRGWSWGGYDSWDYDDDPLHYSSCPELFGYPAEQPAITSEDS